MKNRFIKISVFILFSAFLGFISGTIVWLILKVMGVGISFVWEFIPNYIPSLQIYTIIVCTVGGGIIGLFQKKHGELPETMEDVMLKLKSNGTYEYNRLHIITCAALLPLIFGASVGPEAGLAGVIVGLCCFVGDRLKYKGEQARELANVGLSATLVAIFRTPFLGVAANYEVEKKETSENSRKPHDLEEKRAVGSNGKMIKVIVYCCAAMASFGALSLWSSFLGGSTGLPRFSINESISVLDFIYAMPLILTGLLAGYFIIVTKHFITKISCKLNEHRVISCLIGGMILGLVGAFFPLAMFSGEHEFGAMMDSWGSYTPYFLILIGLIKMVLTNICISFGLKGGEFFPIIFSTSCLGFALAGIFGISPAFATAVVIATALGVTMRKPVMVIAILLLCFPITVVIPVGVSAFIGSTFSTKVANKFANSRNS